MLSKELDAADRIKKRKWIQDRFDVLLTHVAYYRGFKDHFSIFKDVIFKVGSDGGSKKI